MKASTWAAKMASDLGTTGPTMTGPTPNTAPKPLSPSVPKAILPTSTASARPPVVPSIGQSARSASLAMTPATKTAATACKKAPRYSMAGKGGKKAMPRPHDRQRKKKKAAITKFGEKMAFSPGSPAMGSAAPTMPPGAGPPAVPPTGGPASPAPPAPAAPAGPGVGALGPEMMQGDSQPSIAAQGFGGELGQPMQPAQPQPGQPQPGQQPGMDSPIIQRLMEQLGMGGQAGAPAPAPAPQMAAASM